MDYSICGASGEPRVIAIDNELMMDGINPKPLILADNFESFIVSIKPVIKHKTTKSSDKCGILEKKYCKF